MILDCCKRPLLSVLRNETVYRAFLTRFGRLMRSLTSSPAIIKRVPAGKKMTGLGVLFLLVFSAFLAGCTESQDPLPLKAAFASQPDNALNFIAYEKGYFKKHGLDIQVDFFPSGKRAIHDGFLKHDYDIATTAEVPFVFALDENPDLRIFASLYGADNVNRIVTRWGVGFNSIDQIAGKVIGTQKSSAVHYFFHRIYNAFEIPRSDFTLKFYPAEELPQALANGEIDAFSMREPYVSQAEALLDGEVNIFSMPGIYHQFGVAITREETLQQKNVQLERYLQALFEARNFAITNPQESIEILAEYLSISIPEARALWRPSNLQLGLHQGLINTIESEIQWRNFLTDLGLDDRKVDLEVFDLSDYVHVDVMSKVNPYAVMVVYERQKSE